MITWSEICKWKYKWIDKPQKDNESGDEDERMRRGWERGWERGTNLLKQDIPRSVWLRNIYIILILI